MRPSILAIVAIVGLAGCAGNVADFIGPRSNIISNQLVRYGLDPGESRCVGQQLGSGLTPLQLRRFERIASAVRRGYFEPGRLTLRDLLHVAATMSDPEVRFELSRATQECGVTNEVDAVAGAAPSPPAPPPPAPSRPAAWLNLGTAPTGQGIAVDASTLEQDASSRRAWFRLTNPGDSQPLANAYLLRIDCIHRTIQALARRREDAGGGVTGFHEYVEETDGPMPVEGGTVMEIAFLALCT